MRVCPKCGFIDPPEWKHTKYSYYIDSCSFQNFKKLHPQLASQLTNPGTETEDTNYAYRRTTSGHHVLRKAKIDIGVSNIWGDGCEKHDTNWVSGRSKLPDPGKTYDFLKYWDKYHPDQTKLLEV